MLVKIDTIRNIVRKVLLEFPIEKKPQFARGMEHTLYEYKRDPSKLFKVGEKDVVDEWVKVFKKFPTLFPKIYSVGKLGQTNNYYVLIEKLDTTMAETEWQELENKLEEIGVTDPMDEEDEDYGRDITDIYINHKDDDNVINDIKTRLMNYDQNAYKSFVKWFGLFKKCEKAIEKVLGRTTLVDAHRYNFGYDSEGNLKCLDI